MYGPCSANEDLYASASSAVTGLELRAGSGLLAHHLFPGAFPRTRRFAVAFAGALPMVHSYRNSSRFVPGFPLAERATNVEGRFHRSLAELRVHFHRSLSGVPSLGGWNHGTGSWYLGGTSSPA